MTRGINFSAILLALASFPAANGQALAQASDQEKSTVANLKSGAFSFAVSGDSRNCGDVVMPAIAEGVRKEGAAFYWHLGDFRAIYDFDEDFIERHPKTSILDYEDAAWKDFIAEQLDSFGDLPV